MCQTFQNKFLLLNVFSKKNLIIFIISGDITVCIYSLNTLYCTQQTRTMRRTRGSGQRREWDVPRRSNRSQWQKRWLAFLAVGYSYGGISRRYKGITRLYTNRPTGAERVSRRQSTTALAIDVPIYRPICFERNFRHVEYAWF